MFEQRYSLSVLRQELSKLEKERNTLQVLTTTGTTPTAARTKHLNRLAELDTALKLARRDVAALTETLQALATFDPALPFQQPGTIPYAELTIRYIFEPPVPERVQPSAQAEEPPPTYLEVMRRRELAERKAAHEPPPEPKCEAGSRSRRWRDGKPSKLRRARLKPDWIW